MSISRHKLVRAITAQELEQLLEDLAGMTNVTGARIREIAEERFGVEMGHDAANNFRTDVFGAYLEKMRARREKSRMMAEVRDEGTGRLLADAASEELQQQLFDFMMTAELDFNNPEDVDKANILARIIKSARSEDRKMIHQLEQKLAAAEEKEKQTAKAVLAAASDKGASPQLVSAIREAMNFRPKPAPSEASAKEEAKS